MNCEIIRHLLNTVCHTKGKRQAGSARGLDAPAQVGDVIEEVFSPVQLFVSYQLPQSLVLLWILPTRPLGCIIIYTSFCLQTL